MVEVTGLPSAARAARNRADVPAEWAGAAAEIEDLIAQDKVEDAAAAFAGLPENAGRQAWYIQLGIKLARRRNDTDAVLQLAASLRSVAPDNPAGYFTATRALRDTKRLDEAEALAAQAIERFPRSARAWREGALLARLRGDSAAAIVRWEEVIRRSTVTREDIFDAVTAARATGRKDLAVAYVTKFLIVASARDAPAQPAQLTTAARQAVTAGNWQEAGLLWGRLAVLTPDDPAPAIAAATALAGERRNRKRRIAAVQTYLELIQARFPHHVPVYIAQLNALREIQAFDEAEERAAAWSGKFKDNVPFILARVRLAEDSGAVTAALAQIEAARGRLPPAAVLEAAYIRVLARLEMFGQAEAASADAMARFPADRDLLSEYARIATRQGDWQTAVLRWTSAVQQRPADKQVARGLRVAQDLLANQGLAAPRQLEGGQHVFNQFESLGGTTWGCEFGIAQQRLSAGSIGFFRWSTLSLHALIDVLEHRFEGIGSAETTTLTTLRHAFDNEEYIVRDNRYGFGTHTFVKTADAPPDKTLAAGCKRAKFLAGKLASDLAEAERICIFKIAVPTPESDIRALHAALRSYGDVALLCVLKADELNPGGSVRELSRGLFIGYLTNFTNGQMNTPNGIDVPAWQVVCAETNRRWAADRETRQPVLPAETPDLHAPAELSAPDA